ncbi:hypothetical protein C8R45DRAFT_505571 [Mycena sanguinolenta]|nr:hypothetical protein C8R45DRAFT_505571 [Mycena sanguinolenta]
MSNSTSMSIEELQVLARIDKISADIEVQEKALRQLRISKSAAQRELNALRDPIALLPVEISSEIFLQCLPSLPTPMHHEAPVLLMNVCHIWSDIALSTPTLWASIHLKLYRSGDKVLQSWFPRARNCSLSVSMDGYSPDTALFQRHASQLKHLTLYTAVPHFNPSTSFSSLETLALGTLTAKVYAELDLRDLVGLFRLTPNLVRCTLPYCVVYPLASDELADSHLPIVTLPNLRCLEFGEEAVLKGWASGDEILRHLSLPALETLAIPFLEVPFTDLSLFLQRSLPPLRMLVLSTELYRIELTYLDWLRLLPSLTHFELYARSAGLDADLFTALADSKSLLPSLRNMKITTDSLSYYGVLYQTVLRAFSNRHPQLVCFHLYTECHIPLPDPEILHELRHLVTDGMDILIGDQRASNHISN